LRIAYVFTLLLLTLNKVDLEAFYALEFDFVRQAPPTIITSHCSNKCDIETSVQRSHTIKIITLPNNSIQLQEPVPRYYRYWSNMEDYKDIQQLNRGDEANKPLLNQVNYVLLNLHLAGKHDAKPSHEELKDWLHNGQVDVLRISAK
jgi:hypothetical protein